jgi:hypothetical protein
LHYNAIGSVCDNCYLARKTSCVLSLGLAHPIV